MAHRPGWHRRDAVPRHGLLLEPVRAPARRGLPVEQPPGIDGVRRQHLLARLGRRLRRPLSRSRRPADREPHRRGPLGPRQPARGARDGAPRLRVAALHVRSDWRLRKRRRVHHTGGDGDEVVPRAPRPRRRRGEHGVRLRRGRLQRDRRQPPLVRRRCPTRDPLRRRAGSRREGPCRLRPGALRADPAEISAVLSISSWPGSSSSSSAGWARRCSAIHRRGRRGGPPPHRSTRAAPTPQERCCERRSSISSG